LAVPVSDSRILRTLRLVAASLFALVSLTFLASAAGAQTNETGPYGNTVPTVQGTTTVPEEPTTTPTVLGTSQTRDLAFTGGDLVGLVAIGGGAVAIGTALVLAARRRRSLELA
jgi:hypothetical protein